MFHPSVRLFFFSHLHVYVRPALLLIGMLEILMELVNSQTILYILLVSFLLADSCASAPSIQCLLSLLQLFFTSLSFSLFLSSCVFHPCESFVWYRAFLVLFVHLSATTSHRKSTSPCWSSFSSPISSLR